MWSHAFLTDHRAFWSLFAHEFVIGPPKTGVNGANVWSPVFHYYLNGLKQHFVKEHRLSLQFCREFASWLLFSCLSSCHFCLLFVFIFCFFVSLPFPSLSCLHVPSCRWVWHVAVETIQSNPHLLLESVSCAAQRCQDGISETSITVPVLNWQAMPAPAECV